MGSGAKRGLAAAGTVVLAAAVNVTTGLLTQRWAIAWWVATTALVVVGGGLQWWLTVANDDASARSQEVDHAVVGGSLQQRIRGVGRQEVRRSRITGDLSQQQGGGDADAGR
jgi:hypothetical protein